MSDNIRKNQNYEGSEKEELYENQVGLNNQCQNNSVYQNNSAYQRDSQYGHRIGEKAKEYLHDKGVRGFLAGVGATALAIYAWPKVSSALRPVAVKVVQEAISLTECTISKLSVAKENVEDIVAEAKANHEAEMEAAFLAEEAMQSEDEDFEFGEIKEERVKEESGAVAAEKQSGAQAEATVVKMTKKTTKKNEEE